MTARLPHREARCFDEVRDDPNSSYRAVLKVFGPKVAAEHRRITNGMINGGWRRRARALLGDLRRILRRFLTDTARRRTRIRCAVAGRIELDAGGTVAIWVPPAGRPYWVRTGKPNAGPDLTDEEIQQYLPRLAGALCVIETVQKGLDALEQV